MNILFITYDFPYPTNSGGKTRSLNMIKYGIEDLNLYLFSFIREEIDKTQIDRVKQLGVKEIYTHLRKKVLNLSNLNSLISDFSIYSNLYYSKQVEERLLEIIVRHHIDLVHFESYYTGFYIYNKIRSLPIKIVYGSENIEHLIYKDIAMNHKKLSVRLFMKTQFKKIKTEEQKMIKLADLVLSVNKKEAEYFRKINPNVLNIPNGTRLHAKINSRKISNGSILFVGNFTYYPNIDGMDHFINEILPRINNLKKIIIVGKGSSNYKKIGSLKVETHEFIKTKEKLYGLGSIMVSPIRIGGGTNFKVIEALSFGVPTVAYKNRLIGLDLIEDQEILSAENDTEFIDKLNNLLVDSSLYQTLRINGKTKVEKLYSWEKIGRDLNMGWKGLSR